MQQKLILKSHGPGGAVSGAQAGATLPKARVFRGFQCASPARRFRGFVQKLGREITFCVDWRVPWLAGFVFSAAGGFWRLVFPRAQAMRRALARFYEFPTFIQNFVLEN